MVDLVFWKVDFNLVVHEWWLVSKCALHAYKHAGATCRGAVGTPLFSLPWKILSFKCSEIDSQAISRPKMLSVCVHAGVFSHALQWHTVQELGRLYIHTGEKWLLSLKFEAVLTTLDSYHDLDTWWEITYHQTKCNYDVIIDHAHTFLYVRRKIAVGKIAKLSSYPSC